MSAGDELEAKVKRNATGTWTVTVTDVTSGQRTTASEPVKDRTRETPAAREIRGVWLVQATQAVGERLRPLAETTVRLERERAAPPATLVAGGAVCGTRRHRADY